VSQDSVDYCHVTGSVLFTCYGCDATLVVINCHSLADLYLVVLEHQLQLYKCLGVSTSQVVKFKFKRIIRRL